MKYELRKIGKDSRLCLLLVLVILLNGIMFYEHCVDDAQGYTLAQIGERYQHLETLVQEQEDLKAHFLEYLYIGASDTDWDTITIQMDINQEALNRIEQARGYPEYRAGLIAESELKLKLGLFGDSESFAARSLRRGIQAYTALADVKPDAVFLGAAESLLNYRITDWLLLVFAVVAGLILFTYEQGAGLQNITRATKNGHGSLFLRKFAASTTLLTIGFVFLYGENILIAGVLFGYEHLSCPIQGLYGFANCLAMLSVGEALIQFFVLKYLWAFSCLTLVLFICAGTGTAALATAGMTLCGGLAYWMGKSQSLWLRNISLMQLADAESFYRETVYLNFFGNPLERIPVAVIFLLLLAAVSICTGFFLFGRTPRLGGQTFKLPSRLFRRQHTNIFCHECYKTFSMWKGGWMITALIVIQLASYWHYPANNSEFEYYYRTYSTILAGEPDSEKDAYLQKEQARFDELNEQLAELYRRYPDPGIFEQKAQDTQNALRPQEAFLQAKKQYLDLRAGQSYLYLTGYAKLLGPEAFQESILNLCKAFFVLTLLLATIFAEERESGIRILQVSSRHSRAVFYSKIGIAFICSVVIAIAAFLPKFIAVFAVYGGLDWSAWANSTPWTAFLPDFLPVGWLFAGIMLSKILLISAAGGAACWISYKSPNTIIAFILTTAALLIPTGMVYLWSL